MYGYNATWQIEGRGESKQKKETEKKDKKRQKGQKRESNLHGSGCTLVFFSSLAQQQGEIRQNKRG